MQQTENKYRLGAPTEVFPSKDGMNTVVLHHEFIKDVFTETRYMTPARVGHTSREIHFDLEVLKIMRPKFSTLQRFEEFVAFLTLWCMFKIPRSGECISDFEADDKCVKYFKEHGISMAGIVAGLAITGDVAPASAQACLNRIKRIR